MDLSIVVVLDLSLSMGFLPLITMAYLIYKTVKK